MREGEGVREKPQLTPNGGTEVTTLNSKVGVDAKGDFRSGPGADFSLAAPSYERSMSRTTSKRARFAVEIIFQV